MTNKMFSGEKLSQAGQKKKKKQQRVGVKVGIKFMKKTKPVKPYAYRMLLSFNTSVTYNFF